MTSPKINSATVSTVGNGCGMIIWVAIILAPIAEEMIISDQSNMELKRKVPRIPPRMTKIQMRLPTDMDKADTKR